MLHNMFHTLLFGFVFGGRRGGSEPTEAAHNNVVGSFVSLGMVHDVLPTQALDAQVVQEFPFDHVHWLCKFVVRDARYYAQCFGARPSPPNRLQCDRSAWGAVNLCCDRDCGWCSDQVSWARGRYERPALLGGCAPAAFREGSPVPSGFDERMP